MGWAGERVPGSQRVLTPPEFLTHTELITVVSDDSADTLPGRFYALMTVFFVTEIRSADQRGTEESSVWRPSLENFEDQALSLTKSERHLTQ